MRRRKCDDLINKKMIQSISRKEADKLIEENKGKGNFVILDIRTPEEFSAGAIKQAINIDFYSPDFSEKIKNLDKDKIYLIYCRSGNRSKAALALMEGAGFSSVYEIDEGLLR